VGVAAATLVGGSAAWAADPTHPTLHQHDQHILASNASFKQNFGTCGAQQGANEDVWVFVWPGGSDKVGTVTDVQISWDTNGDGTADTTRGLAMGSPGVDPLDNGTPKVAFVTPAGWRLESGTSTISGQVSTFGNDGFAEGFFNLTHACAGTVTTPAPSSPPPSSKPPTSAPPTSYSPGGSESPSTPPATTNPPVETSPAETTPPDGGLPVTGAALGGVIFAGLAMVAAGIAAVLIARRRRDRPVV
jgi:hypothetical protein